MIQFWLTNGKHYIQISWQIDQIWSTWPDKCLYQMVFWLYNFLLGSYEHKGKCHNNANISEIGRIPITFGWGNRLMCFAGWSPSPSFWYSDVIGNAVLCSLTCSPNQNSSTEWETEVVFLGIQKKHGYTLMVLNLSFARCASVPMRIQLGILYIFEFCKCVTAHNKI